MGMLLTSIFARPVVAAETNTTATEKSIGRTGPFILGADISWLPEDEARGAQYFDNGVKKDLVALLKEHNFNYIRLRIFVDPKSQAGYARRQPKAFNDLEHTLAMAKRVKAAGMGLMICFHYSDTWADPEHQPKPAAWRDLAFPELVTTLGDYTRKVITALKEQGTTPDMVQIGNEITHGMLWPDGRVGSKISSGNAQTDANQAAFANIDNYDNLATLLKAGITATREVDPSIKIMLHNHLGRHNLRVREWVDGLLARGVEFDTIGLSCYAQGQEGDWETNFQDLAKRYPKHNIVVAEYSARKRYLNDLTYAIPDKKGLGTFVWEPTRHREALFDRNGRNAGGGQASNFVNDLGTNQGATVAGPRPAPIPRTVNPGTTDNTTAAPAVPAPVAPTTGQSPTTPVPSPRRGNGNRYDTNEFLDLYPVMARDYGNLTPPSNETKPATAATTAKPATPTKSASNKSGVASAKPALAHSNKVTVAGMLWPLGFVRVPPSDVKVNGRQVPWLLPTKPDDEAQQRNNFKRLIKADVCGVRSGAVKGAFVEMGNEQARSNGHA